MKFVAFSRLAFVCVLSFGLISAFGSFVPREMSKDRLGLQGAVFCGDCKYNTCSTYEDDCGGTCGGKMDHYLTTTTSGTKYYITDQAEGVTCSGGGICDYYKDQTCETDCNQGP